MCGRRTTKRATSFASDSYAFLYPHTHTHLPSLYPHTQPRLACLSTHTHTCNSHMRFVSPPHTSRLLHSGGETKCPTGHSRKVRWKSDEIATPNERLATRDVGGETKCPTGHSTVSPPTLHLGSYTTLWLPTYTHTPLLCTHPHPHTHTYT